MFFVPQLLSFVAFVLEEVVSNCTSCGPLYFFEFVSCTAFLFTLLLLVLLVTPLYLRVGITCWPQLVFGFVATVVFFIDLGLFVMNQGIPCLKRSPAADNPPVPVAEAEKLNANGNE
uniref:CKLF-like MARVEL transmembrane domain containing 6 n=1 Tax=Astyanax mexicanus TaxID=7994 RepID=A0A8B9JEP5_ASTMX